LLYAQIPAVVGEAPTLMVVTSSNLTLQQTLQLPENLAGKSVLSKRFQYPLLHFRKRRHRTARRQPRQQPRVVAQQEDLIFRGNFCNPGVSTQQLTIVDPGGNNTPFSISSDTAGVSVSPGAGVTPAVVTVSVDPTAFLGQSGTVAQRCDQSNTAINVIPAFKCW
jgi:hypothetical protein